MSLLRNQTPAFLLLLGLGLAGTAPRAQAHVGSGLNCINCHTTKRDAFGLTDAQKKLGGTNVYTVKPGESVPIGINVTSGASQHGVGFNTAKASGVADPANKLLYKPDATWTTRGGGTYYSQGPLKQAAKKWTYTLAVSASTKPDLYPVTVQVAGLSPEWGQRTNFYVEVQPLAVVNHPPTITPVGAKDVNEGTPLTFKVVASDIDAGQTLTYTLGPGAPTDATIGLADGQFAWTPKEADGPVKVTLKVIAADNATPPLKATNSFDVTVQEVNVKPTLDPLTDPTGVAGSRLTFKAVGHDGDLPVQLLSYRLGGDVPTGANLDAATGDFAWTPERSHPASTNLVEVIVVDNGTPVLSATNAVKLVVQALPPPPIPQVVSPIMKPEGFSCAVATAAGYTYFLDFKAALSEATWTPRAQIVGDGTVQPLADPNPLGDVGYYRVRAE